MSNSSNSNRSLSLLHQVAIASLTVAILSFLSPQVGMLGHGLRTTLTALMVSSVAISMISPSAFIRAFVRFRITFLLGFVFLAQAAFRFMYETYRQDEMWNRYFNGPILVLIFLLWIAALSELGDDTVHRMRCWLLFSWCLCIAVSLPILIENPGVARSTMGNRDELVNAAKWAPRGVAEYSIYSTIGICLGPLFAVTHWMKSFWRRISLLLIILTALAVLFSTFTMAAFMVMVSLISMLLIWAIAGRGVKRIVRLLMIFFPLVMLPTLYDMAHNFEQTEFIVTKVERLTQGISNKGLANGDETDRGEMFMDEMKSFFEEPFMGYIPGVTGQRGHGHSSFANSLVLFGIFGALLWVGALYKVFRISLDNTLDQFDQHAAKVAWLVFVLSGILNPIWHATAALAALFALTLPARKISVPAADER